jgi:hypothetical protein
MSAKSAQNIAPPEPVIFLELALDAMKKHGEENGFYPSKWHQLDVAFSGGPTYAYRVGEPGTFPTEADGNAWQPRDCQYRYVIESSGQSFRITAQLPNKAVVYELTEKMEAPRKLMDSPFDAPVQIHK